MAFFSSREEISEFERKLMTQYILAESAKAASKTVATNKEAWRALLSVMFSFVSDS